MVGPGALLPAPLGDRVSPSSSADRPPPPNRHGVEDENEDEDEPRSGEALPRPRNTGHPAATTTGRRGNSRGGRGAESPPDELPPPGERFREGAASGGNARTGQAHRRAARPSDGRATTAPSTAGLSRRAHPTRQAPRACPRVGESLRSSGHKRAWADCAKQSAACLLLCNSCDSDVGGGLPHAPFLRRESAHREPAPCKDGDASVAVGEAVPRSYALRRPHTSESQLWSRPPFRGGRRRHGVSAYAWRLSAGAWRPRALSASCGGGPGRAGRGRGARGSQAPAPGRRRGR